MVGGVGLCTSEKEIALTITSSATSTFNGDLGPYTMPVDVCARGAWSIGQPQLCAPLCCLPSRSLSVPSSSDPLLFVSVTVIFYTPPKLPRHLWTASWTSFLKTRSLVLRQTCDTQFSFPFPSISGNYCSVALLQLVLPKLITSMASSVSVKQFLMFNRVVFLLCDGLLHFCDDCDAFLQFIILLEIRFRDKSPLGKGSSCDYTIRSSLILQETFCHAYPAVLLGSFYIPRIALPHRQSRLTSVHFIRWVRILTN